MKYHIILPNHSLQLHENPGVLVALRSLLSEGQGRRMKIHVEAGPNLDRSGYPDIVNFIPWNGELDGGYVHTVANLNGSDHGIEPDDWVLRCDIRDVLFQRWFWDHSILRQPDRVHVFAESSAYRLGTERANMSWQSTLHHGETPMYVSRGKICCFGVMAGKWNRLQPHFQSVLRIQTAHGFFYGADQAAHNTLIATHPEQFAIHDNETGPVHHCCLTQPVAVCRYVQNHPPEFLHVIQPGGDVPSIVHQMDRYPELMRLIFARYIPEVKIQ